MKQLLDFFPLVVFFIFYKLYDIFVASGALIAASGLALVASWVLYRKVEKMTIVTFVLVAVFGTLTLVFHNDEFIKWKVTAIYSLFALALLYSQFFMAQPLIKSLLGKEIQLQESSWRRLNVAWALFFLACGLANIYVAFWLPEAFWVKFKVFGLTVLTLIFTLLSGLYIWRRIPQQEEK
ncbi:septation protein A [Candidatus Pantoea persica]|uniref:septation protein A n=1 Tax=Candidatus Pantoea persica TaxID=2518128 RepID=UPI00215D6498|nr:septation protein A [Candidatus Pantoea persica]MBA2814461.1 putative intracellular septation protein A [Candidatus Pantoea persica]